MLVLRALRPDRLLDALAEYVSEVMGDEYVSEPPFDMEGTWRETSKGNQNIVYVLLLTLFTYIVHTKY